MSTNIETLTHLAPKDKNCYIKAIFFSKYIWNGKKSDRNKTLGEKIKTVSKSVLGDRAMTKL